MFKKLFIIGVIFFALAGFVLADLVLAENKATVHLFYKPGCPFCQAETQFVQKLEQKYPDFEVIEHNIFEETELLEDFYQQYKVPSEMRGAVPISFLEERFFLGYRSDETTGAEIEGYLKELLQKPSATSTATSTDSENISFLGFNISLQKASPLLLAVVLGALDGFNACAMLALAFLLTMLVATGSRRRLLLIGGTFILVSGIVYFLFITAWLNLFLVSKNFSIITTVVGVVILLSAAFLLRDYFLNIVCRVCRIEPGKGSILTRTEQGLFAKLKKLTKPNVSLPLMLLAVALIAAGINSIELVCSFGFPLAFTKILSGLDLSLFSYYFYIFIYILFYMLDDFLIFLLAVFTLKITGISEKYLKAVKLISGLVLLALGLIMLLNPQLLSFI